MTESILLTIKKNLGLDADYLAFDQDIIVFINSAIMVLVQLGVVSDAGYILKDETQTWDEIISDEKILGLVQNYIYVRVRKDFDPPTNGTVMESLNANLREYEWRLNIEVDPGEVTNG